MGDVGLFCRNRHKAQSMPSMLVPLLSPKTVKSRAAISPFCHDLELFSGAAEIPGILSRMIAAIVVIKTLRVDDMLSKKCFLILSWLR